MCCLGIWMRVDVLPGYMDVSFVCQVFVCVCLFCRVCVFVVHMSACYVNSCEMQCTVHRFRSCVCVSPRLRLS